MNRKHHAAESRRRRARGFTLIELLVVLTILALIGGIVGTQVLKYVGTAKSETAKLQINQIGSALDLYRLDVGRYPTQQEGLKALVERPANAARWNGPYLKGGQLPTDPWDRAYIYRVPGAGGRDFDVLSLGADGQSGGAGEASDLASR